MSGCIGCPEIYANPLDPIVNSSFFKMIDERYTKLQDLERRIDEMESQLREFLKTKKENDDFPLDGGLTAS